MTATSTRASRIASRRSFRKIGNIRLKRMLGSSSQRSPGEGDEDVLQRPLIGVDGEDAPVAHPGCEPVGVGGIVKLHGVLAAVVEEHGGRALTVAELQLARSV